VLLEVRYQTQREVYRVLGFPRTDQRIWLARRICVELLGNEGVEARRRAAEREAERAAGRG